METTIIEDKVNRARMRELMKAKKIRQADIARLLDCTPGAITHKFQKKRAISITELISIADLLDTSVEDLIEKTI